MIELVYGDVEFYLFDEIQNLNEWEYLVSRLHRVNKNVIITGSNSKLLSRELTTALTGRHIPIYMMPFTYEEYCIARGVDKKRESLGSYLKTGGFPELVMNPELTGYLEVLLDSLIFRDLLDRYKLRKVEDLKNLANYILGNPSIPTTIKSLQNMTEIESRISIQKYVFYLEEIFAIIQIHRFSIKQKQRQLAYKKMYPIDVGYIHAKKRSLSEDSGKILEAFIATELYKRCLREKLELFYYKTKNDREVDFIIKKDNQITELIQVCDTLNRGNVKREVEALREASKELHCHKKILYVNNVEVFGEIDGVEVLFGWEV